MAKFVAYPHMYICSYRRKVNIEKVKRGNFKFTKWFFLFVTLLMWLFCFCFFLIQNKYISRIFDLVIVLITKYRVVTTDCTRVHSDRGNCVLNTHLIYTTLMVKCVNFCIRGLEFKSRCHQKYIRVFIG